MLSIRYCAAIGNELVSGSNMSTQLCDAAWPAQLTPVTRLNGQRSHLFPQTGTELYTELPVYFLIKLENPEAEEAERRGGEGSTLWACVMC